MFKYTIENIDSTTIVVFEGDMDIDVTELIEEELTPALLTSSEIEIDFSKVLFVDSSGIGLLITLVQNIQTQGNTVVIVNLSAEVMQIFALLQLPEILGPEVLADFRGSVDL
ncbi:MULTISPECIES: STAS domain-containing protein [unclassified Paenibacillus]|uniref:STAS domain-containing protein n=1 Tax=unclassified Paenibacillus TaxID=185978 RepID=UPI001AEAB8D3|nr:MULTISPECIES: STAS domain-containing protein [unclassified Paenibacillus]MBP1153985.1 anti-anti-sigma factor [Paenibacillus sp. PvP091]MBP1170630.1 anti-anti-sigma factor [Paenibacillus sp. PvR098]MBP2441658.1 anti-anti-sigma factor [Paenibacillus sp. PvP052]